MTRKTKTWAEKMKTKPPHTAVLEKDFAGIPAGAKLLISSPLEIEAYLRERVPAGTTKDIPQLRRELAKRHKGDATCPLTTAIFLRIVSENAWDQIEAGAKHRDVAPFWRVVDPKSPLAKKLRAGPDWIARQRQTEAAS
jgi:hypothetical protein